LHHGMSEQMVPFQAMSGDPEDYPGKILEQALTDDQVDAAIIWGPIAGYFAKQAEDVEMVIIPLHSEPGAKFDFAISAGVRRGEDAAKEELEQLMDETSGEIQALLQSYNVPLLEIGPPAPEAEDDRD
jgi:mxaJ protein